MRVHVRSAWRTCRAEQPRGIRGLQFLGGAGMGASCLGDAGSPTVVWLRLARSAR